MYIFNGGIADDIFVNDYACLYVSNGGILNCADVYRDGTDDIAWCNTDSGLTGYWQIKDKTLESWQNTATIA